jgi:exosortase A
MRMIMYPKRKVLDILSLSIFLAAFGLLYWETIYTMVKIWYKDPNYSHGFLIPFLSGYFLWQRRDGLKTVGSGPSNAGLLILLSGIGIYLLGNLSGELFSMRFSILVVIAGVILFAYGTEFFKEITFPFFYLIFMLPLPYILYDSAAFPLKMIVSKFSVDFLNHIGVLVLREGNIIHLADITLEVADACSGIRSIVSLLALSTALAYLTQNGFIKRTVLVVLAVPIAIFVNAIRVIGTGILADRYGSQVAEGFFHEFAGLLIFGVAIAIMIVSASQNVIKTAEI